MDTHPLSTSRIAKIYNTNSDKLQKAYKHNLSDYNSWRHKSHAEDWILYGKNLGKYLSIDETSLSKGELYTIVTNKEALGQKGTIVAMIKGTRSEDVIRVLEKLPLSRRNMVKEVTLDMAANMNLIAKRCFKKAMIVTDRFHVQMLASEAVQEQRIKYRWEAISQENKMMKESKSTGYSYQAEVLSNGDTVRQLLARSRHLLFKSPSKWTISQSERAVLLFERYPRIYQAYKLSQSLSGVFSSCTNKDTARLELAKWYQEVEKANFESFQVISRTIYHHYDKILNYFINRSTNASAESFNAKIKDFRRQFRGVKDIPFFLYRLSKLYA